MSDIKKGLLIVLSGPSGVGKYTTWSQVLQEKDLNLWMSISCTTRNRRPYEIDGKDYFFITKEEFENKIKNNEMFEWTTFCNNFYGTLRSPIEQHRNLGQNVILEIEVEGAMNVLNYYKEKGDNKIVSVFMAPPSLESLKQRLVGRGTETIEQIEKRLSRASEELSLADKYDKVIVLNNIDEGVNEFRNFIKEEIKKHD